MEINVFKFGGASVNSADGILNLGKILNRYSGQKLILVISAMGKTTNALEELLGHYFADDTISMNEKYQKIREFHFDILHRLFPDEENPVFPEVESLFEKLKDYLQKGHPSSGGKKGSYDFEYDQIVSYGELVSTSIIHHALVLQGIVSRLFDVRTLVRTDSSYRDAIVDWDTTPALIKDHMERYFLPDSETGQVATTQGFIGGDCKGHTTTLGREGSDYTAAIFAYSLGIKELTIWKDVPGVMNADPKWFKNASRIDLLSYREAIELAYYGASVIHPKTIKPLENAGIRLIVKSFLNPDDPGTSIENIHQWNISIPFYIRKLNQALISISPRDFSFIVEENLSHIFKIFALHHVKVNVMQNSAISFTVCVDNSNHSLKGLIAEMQKDYTVRYNDGVELYTIRHYNPSAIRRVTRNRRILMEQKTRNTIHLVVIPEGLQESHI